MSDPAPVRIFVVGCPRSGTTLLQSMLAAHPAVMAFPETHALWELESANPLWRRARLRSRRVEPTWKALPGLGVPVRGSAPWPIGSYVRRFAAAMDEAAGAGGRTAWSEKTPGHLRSTHLISAYVPGAHVVHVVRRGVPTVTSLFAVTREHEDAWDGGRSLDLCLTRWRNDLRRSAACVGRPGHVFVAYEDLVGDPERVLGALVAALGLAGGEVVGSMVEGYRRSLAGVVGAGEVWKQGNDAPLVDRNAARSGMLPPAEQSRLAEAVALCEPTYAGLTFL